MTYDPNDAKSIFLQAMELPFTSERAEFVAKICAGRPELQARVEMLLKTALDPDSLLDQPVAEIDTAQMTSRIPEVSLDFLQPCDVPGSLGRLGAYAILEVIGRGGMGIVLRAMDSKLNRVVAIKVLAPEFAGNSSARKRFLREAQAAAAVSHDHVVTIHAVDDDEKLPLLVMECIVGQSLQQKIDKVGPLRLVEILRIGMQAAAGLAAAHAQGLVHRDVKPANILLENGVERVKLTDFGLARMVDDASVTQSGVIAGTPQYMSPEQARGDAVDHRSDLFSLGCVLYAMCVGHAPFRASTTMGVLKRVCDENPRPIRESNPEIPDWLVRIVDKLLSKQPAERYQTAAEVSDLLRQCLAHVQQPSLVSLPQILGESARQAPAMTPSLPTPRSRGRLWLVAVIGIVLILTFGVVEAWLYRPLAVPSAVLLSQPDASSASSTTAENAVTTEVEPEKGEGNATAAKTPPRLAVTPFNAAQALHHQQQWAAYLNLPVEQTDSAGITMRLIPPGRFFMGSTSEELAALKQELEQLGVGDFDKFVAQSSGPKHFVELTKPFYMGVHEVTLSQFRDFVEASSYTSTLERASNARFTWNTFASDANPRQPVCGVSWEDAKAYCQWLTAKESAGPELVVYDLPTEAQWEYACRAGTQSAWSFGNDVQAITEFAIVGQKGMPSPAPVGLRRANPFGLFDMHGNVDEWCLDWHNHNFYARSPVTDPLYVEAPTQGGSGRVARGGAWNADPWWSRSTTRTYDFPETPTFAKGFRVVRRIGK